MRGRRFRHLTHLLIKSQLAALGFAMWEAMRFAEKLKSGRSYPK